MEALRQYVLGITATAMLCAAVLSVVPAGGARDFLRLLSGLLLALCVLRPLRGGASALELALPDTAVGEALAAQGEKEARDAMAAIIKSRTEAYILDKAAALEAEVEVEVTLDRALLPREAHMRGAVSPYARGRLESILSSELGITKEHQQWTG